MESKGLRRQYEAQTVEGLSKPGLTVFGWVVSSGTLSQRVQSTYMVGSMVSAVVTSLMIWVSIPHMGT